MADSSEKRDRILESVPPETWAVRREFLQLSDRRPRIPFKEPDAAGAAVESVADRLLRKLANTGTDSLAARIERRWAGIVSPEIARNAQPSGIENGVLNIRVSGPIWMAELKRESHRLLQRINGAAALPGEQNPVRRLRFQLDYTLGRTPPRAN